MLNLFAIGRGILQESAAREARRRRTARRKFQPAGPPEIRLESREMQSLAFYFSGGNRPLATAYGWAGGNNQDVYTTPFATGAALSIVGHEPSGPNPAIWTYTETVQTSSTIANSQTIGGATNKIGTYVSIINTDNITNNGTTAAPPPVQAFARGANYSTGNFVGTTAPGAADYTWTIDRATGDPAFQSVDLHFHFTASLDHTGLETVNGRVQNSFQTQTILNYNSTFFTVTTGAGPAANTTGFTVTPVAGATNSTSSALAPVFLPWGGAYDVDFTVSTPNSTPLTIGTGYFAGIQTNANGQSAFTPGQHLHSGTLSMAAEYSLTTA